MGKYIRHILAALIAWFVSGLLALVGVASEPGEIAGYVDALTAALYPLVMLIVYAVAEKFMKRFKSLDTEGWIDRLWLKREAAGEGEILAPRRARTI